MQDLLMQLAAKYPLIISIFSVIGILRVVFKPLFSLLHAYADATASTKDNELLASVESSKIYAGFAYVLDFIASIKVGPQAPGSDQAK